MTNRREILSRALYLAATAALSEKFLFQKERKPTFPAVAYDEKTKLFLPVEHPVERPIAIFPAFSDEDRHTFVFTKQPDEEHDIFPIDSERPSLLAIGTLRQGITYDAGVKNGIDLGQQYLPEGKIRYFGLWYELNRLTDQSMEQYEGYFVQASDTTPYLA